ncbi:MAG: zinc ribbon domain-containing protein [Pseudomonadota bacterium]
MPIYEYLCENCGQELEKIQKINDEPLVECPECGKSSLRKKISAVGFQLKGTGWYATDFKDKPKAPVDTPKETTKKED